MESPKYRVSAKEWANLGPVAPHHDVQISADGMILEEGGYYDSMLSTGILEPFDREFVEDFSEYLNTQFLLYEIGVDSEMFDMWVDVLAFREMFKKLATGCKQLSLRRKWTITQATFSVFDALDGLFFLEMCPLHDLSVMIETKAFDEEECAIEVDQAKLDEIMARLGRNWNKATFFQEFEHLVLNGTINSERISCKTLENICLSMHIRQNGRLASYEEVVAIKNIVHEIISLVTDSDWLPIETLSVLVNSLASS